MNRPKALITYDGLPISSGGAHTIRERDRKVIWNTISGFLQKYALNIGSPSICLSLYEGHQVEPSYSSKALSILSERFGKGERHSTVPSPMHTIEYTWDLPSIDVLQTIDLVESLGPTSKHWLGGPVVLGIHSSFLLRNLATSEPFPFQGRELYGNQEAGFKLLLGQSDLSLRLGNPSTCGLFLSLPFIEVAPALQDYVRELENSLPFKLSGKHWSRWQLNAQGTNYYNRKVTVI